MATVIATINLKGVHDFWKLTVFKNDVYNRTHYL